MLVGLGIFLAILLGKIFYIQIINGSYKRDASNNSMYYEYIYPTRGLIYDRNGDILVGNNICYSILVTPREISELDTMALADVLEISPDYIREKMEYYHKNRRRIGFQTQLFLKQVSPDVYMRFAEEEYRFPGFRAQTRNLRVYPYNAGGNLLGYISEVDADFLKAHSDKYRAGDFIGKTGLEAAREEDLRGEKGYRIFLRDSRNRVKDSYENGAYDKDAVPGKNVVTTIDAQLQQYGQKLMSGKMGSVVALEPSSGEILAMVSSPGIDVKALSDIGKYYNDIVKDPRKPMFNRTVMASYPPGSVFKLVNGLIGLQEGVVKTWEMFPCNHGFQYGNNRNLNCHTHISPLSMLDAIAISCNGYFCYVFKNILGNKAYSTIQDAFGKWREYVLSFGFGRKLESDFPSELGGNVPTADYYDKLYKKRWNFQTVISLSIGQGELGATPLQIANLAATVANRGYYYIPHIIKDSEDIKIEEKYHQKQYTMVDRKYFDNVIKGMYMAVNGGGFGGGTAYSAAVAGIDVCGKTGTVQNPHGKDHSVFICFAPMDNPKIAIATYIENAGYGATWACPIASLMIEKYLNGKIDPSRKAEESKIINTRFF